MTPLSDTELVFQVQQNNDEKALDELIERHSGIYVDMIRKFGGKSLSEDQIYNMMGEKDLNIYQAAKEYKPEKSKFSTYLANKARYLCLAGKTKNQKSPHFVDFEVEAFHLESGEPSPTEEVEKIEFQQFFEKVRELIDNHPDERVGQIFQERYFSTTNGQVKPWREISKIFGLSVQGCIYLHNKALPKLKEQITKISHEQVTF